MLPSVTYPDHTTLITGVWPEEHGIYNNALFDPDRKLNGAWYWYAESIRGAYVVGRCSPSRHSHRKR